MSSSIEYFQTAEFVKSMLFTVSQTQQLYLSGFKNDSTRKCRLAKSRIRTYSGVSTRINEYDEYDIWHFSWLWLCSILLWSYSIYSTAPPYCQVWPVSGKWRANKTLITSNKSSWNSSQSAGSSFLDRIVRGLYFWNIFILATVSDNSVRYQAINVVKRWENKH